MYRVAATCSAASFVNPVDGRTYYGDTSIQKLLCVMAKTKGVNPDHLLDAWETYRFAHDLAVWVRHVLGLHDSESAALLKYGFYVDVSSTTTACLETKVTTSGGGEPLCRLLAETAVTGDGSLVDYLVNLLDYGLKVDSNGQPNFDKWKWTADLNAQVRRIGFEPFTRFVHQYDYAYPYNPTLDINGEEEQAMPGWPGIKGLGGSGAGFEIFCVNQLTVVETTLVTGGGGGGAAVSDFLNNTAKNSASGGGGGGVQIGAKGVPHINAGAGSDPTAYGKVTSHTPKSMWQPFASAMANQVIPQLKACHASKTSVVVLRGGGDGSASFSVSTDFKTPDYNVAYGFQFAMGLNAKLNSDASGQIPFVICPSPLQHEDCLNMTTPPPTSKPTRRPTTKGFTYSPTAFTAAPTVPPSSPNACADAYAMYICQLAYYTVKGVKHMYEPTLTGPCMCLVGKEYTDLYSPYKIPCGDFSFPSPTDPKVFMKAWCPVPPVLPGCNPYPLC